MLPVTRDGQYVVFRLPHSDEPVRLTAAEARYLGTELVKMADLLTLKVRGPNRDEQYDLVWDCPQWGLPDPKVY